MKKLLLLLFVIGLTFTSVDGASKLKAKDIVGNWNYSVETYDGNLTGILSFVEKNKQLEGEVSDNQGNIFKLTKVTIENDTLIFELQPDYDIITVKLKLAEKKLIGIVSTTEGDLGITATKND